MLHVAMADSGRVSASSAGALEVSLGGRAALLSFVADNRFSSLIFALGNFELVLLVVRNICIRPALESALIEDLLLLVN